nr:YdgA family protein [uncultured Glaciecola sp.]
MKKIIISVAAIALVGLVSPTFTGSVINEGLDNFVASLNTAPGYIATIESRETSWFSSAAVVSVGIDPVMFSDLGLDSAELGSAEDFSATINVTAQHGLFLTLNGVGLGLSAWRAEVNDSVFREFLAYAEDEKFYSVTGRVGLFGDVSFEDIMPKFTVITEDGGDEAITFSGWNGKGKASSDNTAYSGATDLVTVNAEGVTFEMKSMTLEASFDSDWTAPMQGDFYNSVSQFAIASINFDMPMLDTSAKLEKLIVDVKTEKSEDGRLMDMSVNYAIESIDAPEFSGRDLVIKTEVNNLERAFFKAYQEASTKPAQMEQAMLDIIETKLLPQLQASPEFNITEMSGNVADGNFSGKVMTKVTGIDSLPEPLEDPAFWISKAVMDANLTLDKAMALWIGEQVIASQIQADPNAANMTNEEIRAIAVEQVEGMIGMFTQQGMITVNADGEYEMTFTMQDGQAMLNGNPMPLPF